MVKIPRQCEPYLHFVRLADKLEGASKIPELDEIEQRLLNVIALHIAEGRSLLVGDLIYTKRIGSPATLQRRVAKLVQMEFIRYGSDVDGRKKYLELTPKSIDYIAKLGECVAAAARKAAV